MTAGEIRGGTGAAFSGYDVLSAEIQRSLGLNPDVSTIEIVMQGAKFPEVDLPKPGQEFAFAAVGANDNIGISPLLAKSSPDDSGRPTTGTRTASLLPMSTFKAMEADEASQWEIILPRLIVDQVVLENPVNADPKIGAHSDDVDGVKILVVTLKDQRALWPTHGRFLPQTEFNVRDAKGEVRPNTQLRILGKGQTSTFPRNGDGVLTKPTFGDVVRFVCRHLPNKGGSGVDVKRVPPRWDSPSDTLEISDWPVALSPYNALRRLLDLRPARLALNADNTVSFWLAGEGRVGHNTTRDQTDNKGELPEEELWQDQIEFGLGWVPGYLTAVGPHTIATVKMPAIPVVFPNRRLSANEVDPDLNLPGASVDDDPGLGGSPEYLYDWWANVLKEDNIRKRFDALDATRRSVGDAIAGGDTTTIIAGQASLIRQRDELQEIQNKPAELTVRDYQYLHRLVLRPDEFLTPNSRISRRTLAIVRRDAFKKWMIEGTVAVQGEEDGSRNLHLLPVEKRAEVDFEGRRRLAKAQTYRYAEVRTPIGGPANALSTDLNRIEPRAAQAAREAWSDAKKLAAAIDEAMSSKVALTSALDRIELDLKLTGEVNAFGRSALTRSTDRQKVGEALKEDASRFWSGKTALVTAIRQDPATAASVAAAGFTFLQFANRLAAEGLAALMPKLKAEAAGYTDIANAYEKRLEVYLKNGPLVHTTLFTGDHGLEVAKQLRITGDLIKLGKLTRADAHKSIPINAARKAIAAAAERAREFNRRKEAGEPLADIQRGPNSQVYNMASHLQNMPLLDDDSLRLADRERGIWESRTPVVQIDATNVPTVAGRTAVPRTVWLVFGTRMKPSYDAKIGGKRPTGSLGTLSLKDGGKPTSGVTGGTKVLKAGNGEGKGQTIEEYTESLLKLKMHPGATPKGPAARPLHRPLDDVVPVIPQQVAELRNDETLGFYAQAFERPVFDKAPKPGQKAPAPKAKDLDDIPADQGAPVRVNDLQELIRLDGVTNRLSLFSQAQEAVSARFAELEPSVKGRERVYLRPWQVALNGIVSGVQWNLQKDQAGWTTTVVQGLPERPFRFQMKTAARRQPPAHLNPRRYPEDRAASD